MPAVLIVFIAFAGARGNVNTAPKKKVAARKSSKSNKIKRTVMCQVR
jgi:hypothetical protein